MGAPRRITMMIGKLVVLAAALSAVAFAAPRTFVDIDAIVPEETLVQSKAEVGSTVSMLKKQFAALEVQLKDGVEITPAITKVIDQMIDMVNDEIEPAITTAHTEDQSEINAKHGVIVDFNADYTNKREMLYNEFNSIQDDIDAHNVAAQTWDDAAAAYSAAVTKYEKDVSDKTDTCCDKQQAAVVALEYTPAYANCDYTAADADKRTDTAKANAATAMRSDFANGLKRYRDLNAGCSKMTGIVATDLADMNSKDEHCDDSQAEALQRQAAISDKKDQFESDWKTTTDDYKSGIAKHESSYSTASARVKSDAADRVNEWGSTQDIKCMLKSYLAGGTFDSAQMSICKGNIAVIHL